MSRESPEREKARRRQDTAWRKLNGPLTIKNVPPPLALDPSDLGAGQDERRPSAEAERLLYGYSCEEVILLDSIPVARRRVPKTGPSLTERLLS